MTRKPALTPRPRYESPDFGRLLEASGVDENTRRLAVSFAEQGFVVIDPEIPHFDRLADEIVQSLAPKYGTAGRIQEAWTFAEAVRSIACAPRVLDLLQTLYGREPFPFQTLNFSRGTQQPVHSDTIHFHSRPEGFVCGVWVALEDVDERNGPVRYFPGSHKLPAFTMQELGLEPAYEAYPYYEAFMCDLTWALDFPCREAHLRKGQALIWAAGLLHGGTPILDGSRTRHSQVTHYYFKGCTYYTLLLSDPAGGRLHQRKIVDLRTERAVFDPLPWYSPRRLASRAAPRHK